MTANRNNSFDFHSDVGHVLEALGWHQDDVIALINRDSVAREIERLRKQGKSFREVAERLHAAARKTLDEKLKRSFTESAGRGRAKGSSDVMTRAQLTKLIASGINPGIAKKYIVQVSDTHVDGPLAGHGGAVFVVFSMVPPGSPEIDALNAPVSFMLAIEAPEWSQVTTSSRGPDLAASRVTVRQFKGRTKIRGRSGTPEDIARYVIDTVNTADTLKRPGTGFARGSNRAGRAGGMLGKGAPADGVRIGDTLVYTRAHPAYGNEEFKGVVVMRGSMGWVVRAAGKGRRGAVDTVEDTRIVRVIHKRKS